MSDGYFFLYSLKYLLLYGLLLDNLNTKCGQAEWDMVLSISLKEMHPFKCFFFGVGVGGEEALVLYITRPSDVILYSSECWCQKKCSVSF